MGREHLAIFISVLLLAGIPIGVLADNIDQDAIIDPPSRAGNHDAINVRGDVELLDLATTEGWPGNGSEENPLILDGFIFDGLSYPIRLSYTDLHLIISNCTFKNSTISLSTSYCSNVSIKECHLEGGDLRILDSIFIKMLDSLFNCSINVNDSEKILMDNCSKRGFPSYQFYFWNIKKLTINDSEFINNFHGGIFHNCNNASIINTIFKNVTGPPISLWAMTKMKIQGTIFENFSRGALDFGNYNKNISIIDCEFKNADDGIVLKGQDFVLVNNTFKDCKPGIEIVVVENLKMYDNGFHNSGIYVVHVEKGFLESRIPENNTIDGKPILKMSDTNLHGASIIRDFSMLILGNVSNTSISNKAFNNPGTEIVLGYCDNIVVESNSFRGMKTALSATYNNNLSINNNSFSETSRYSMKIKLCINVTISGNSFDGYLNDGIDIWGSNDVIISENIISDLRWAIYPRSNVDLYIADNQLINCEYGILMELNTGIIIESNLFLNCTLGINSASTGELLIKDNELIDCTWGIQIIDSYYYDNKVWIVDNDIRSMKGDGIIIDSNVEAELYSNTMEFSGIKVRTISNEIIIPENNTVNGKKVLLLDGQSEYDIDTDEYSQFIILNSDNITINNLDIHNVSSPIQSLQTNDISMNNITIENAIIGLALETIESIHLENLEIINCSDYSMYIRDSSGFELIGSDLIGSGVGVSCLFLEDMMIEGSKFVDCEYGLDLAFLQSNNSISSNEFRNILETGMVIGASSDVSINDNIFNNCSNGVYQINPCNDILYSRNLFYGSTDYAIYIHMDQQIENVIVESNMFFYNNGSGDSYDPFYKQVYCENEIVLWHQNGKGNFWADWTGPDQDNNGIVDIPYEIDEGISDEYPLTEPTRMMVFPPDTLYGVTGDSYVNLSWSEAKKDLLGNETSIVVYRQYGSLDFEELTVVPPGTAYYNDTNVVNGGVYRYHLTARSSLGESEPTKDVLFVPDGIPPVISIVEPANGTYIGSSNVTVRWLASDLHTGLGEVLLKMDDGIWFNVMEDDHFNFSLLMDGVHVIHMKAKDRTGNEVEISSQFFVDTTAPTINISSSTGKNFTNGKGFEIVWNCTDLLSGMDHCKFSVDDGTRSIVFWEGSFEVGDLEHGSHQITIEALDLMGNEHSEEYHFFVDREKPILSIIQPAEGGFVNDPSIQIEWEHWDNDTGIAAIIGTVNDIENWNVSWQTTETDLTLDEGYNDIIITAFDGAGNQISETLSLILDTVAPTVIEKSPEGMDVNISEEVSLTFSEDIMEHSAIIDCDFEYTSQWLENTFIMTPSSPFDKGENYSVSITAYDMAGNEVTVSWTFRTEEPEPVIYDEPKEKEETDYIPIILISLLVLIIIFGVIVFIVMRRNENQAQEPYEE